jgi:hypothetical protein
MLTVAMNDKHSLLAYYGSNKLDKTPVRSQVTSRFATCFHAITFLGSFDPEDGADIFLRNLRLLVNRLHGVVSIVEATSVS